MGYDGEKGGVPRVVKDCAQYLRQTGALVIFRTIPQLTSLYKVSLTRVYFDVPRVLPLCGK